MNKETELLIEQEKKRFQQILEFTTFNRGYGSNRGLVDEDEQDEIPVDNSQSQDQMFGGDDVQMNGGENQDQMFGGDTTMNNQQDLEQTGSDNVQQQDQMMGNGGNTPEGLNPQDNGMDGDITQNDFEGGVETDDEVVDITELTDAQEETNKKVNKLGFNLDKTFKHLSDFEELINSTNEKIAELQKEFEKRNPTQQEKLSARAAVSYPFNVTPEDYWKDKEKTSNYSLDNDMDKKEEFTITRKDIEDSNWKSISDSLSDDLYHQTIGNTLPY